MPLSLQTGLHEAGDSLCRMYSRSLPWKSQYLHIKLDSPWTLNGRTPLSSRRTGASRSDHIFRNCLLVAWLTAGS